MKILVAHNRRRSSSPGGEDRVVDQEHEALVDAGHDVRRFEYFSDAIADFPLRRKALVPLQLLWNRRAARDLGAAIEAFQPDVVHVQNVFPLLSPSVLQSCQRHRKPCVVTFHHYWRSARMVHSSGQVSCAETASVVGCRRRLSDTAATGTRQGPPFRSLWRRSPTGSYGEARAFCLCVHIGRAAPRVGITEVSALALLREAQFHDAGGTEGCHR